MLPIGGSVGLKRTVTRRFSTKKGSEKKYTVSALPVQAPTLTIFGLPLIELMKIQEQKRIEATVPVIVSTCIDYLLPDHGKLLSLFLPQPLVSEEGIFRKSGSQSDIAEMREAIEKVEGILTQDMLLNVFDCHNITGRILWDITKIRLVEVLCTRVARITYPEIPQ